MESNQMPGQFQQGGQPQQQYAPQPTYVVSPQGQQPAAPFKGSWLKLVLGLALFVVAVFAQEIAVFIAFAISDELLVEEVTYEVASSVIALVLFAILGGWRWLKINDRKVLNAIRDCWWLLTLDVALVALTLFEYISEGESLASGWLTSFLLTALMCLGIGLNEEGLFRGLLNGAFLAKFGKTRRSVVACALVSATIFGLFHVLPADPSEMNPLGIIQMVLKTVQTGVCGFTWAIIATRDDDLWGVAIVHGLSDFLLIFPEVIFGSLDDALSTEYVSTGTTEALETIGVYVITILAYLPLIVRTIKIIRDLPAPDYGPFVRPELAAAAAQAGGVAPQPGAVPVATVAPVAPVVPAQQPMAWQQPAQPVPAPQPAPSPRAVDPSLQDAPRSLSQSQQPQYQQPQYQQAPQYPPYQQAPQYPQQPGQGPAGGPPRPAGF